MLETSQEDQDVGSDAPAEQPLQADAPQKPKLVPLKSVFTDGRSKLNASAVGNGRAREDGGDKGPDSKRYKVAGGAHGVSMELNTFAEIGTPGKEPRPCWHFMQGACQFGSECMFQHTMTCDTPMPTEGLEEFIGENKLDDSCANALRAQSPRVQRMVMLRGSLGFCKNPSSACRGRIQDAQNTTLTPEDVEQFIFENQLDEKAATGMRSVRPSVQEEVMSRGPLLNCVNPSQACAARIRNAVEGSWWQQQDWNYTEPHKGFAGGGKAAQPACFSGGLPMASAGPMGKGGKPKGCITGFGKATSSTALGRPAVPSAPSPPGALHMPSVGGLAVGVPQIAKMQPLGGFQGLASLGPGPPPPGGGMSLADLSAPTQDIAPRYTGFLQHAALGPGMLEIEILLATDTSGTWTTGGQTQDIKIGRAGNQVQFEDLTGIAVLRGTVGPVGEIEGSATLRGVGGGTFQVLPDIQ